MYSHQFKFTQSLLSTVLSPHLFFSLDVTEVLEELTFHPGNHKGIWIALFLCVRLHACSPSPVQAQTIHSECSLEVQHHPTQVWCQPVMVLVEIYYSESQQPLPCPLWFTCSLSHESVCLESQ